MQIWDSPFALTALLVYMPYAKRFDRAIWCLPIYGFIFWLSVNHKVYFGRERQSGRTKNILFCEKGIGIRLWRSVELLDRSEDLLCIMRCLRAKACFFSLLFNIVCGGFNSASENSLLALVDEKRFKKRTFVLFYDGWLTKTLVI